MGKLTEHKKRKTANNKRFSEIAPQKASKGKFKKNVIAKRRARYYSHGKGTTGLCIRPSRMSRLIRSLIHSTLKEYAELTGQEYNPDQKVRLYTTFSTPIIGSIDRLLNLHLKLCAAADNMCASRPGGRKLTHEKLDFARTWYHDLSGPEK